MTKMPPPGRKGGEHENAPQVPRSQLADKSKIEPNLQQRPKRDRNAISGHRCLSHGMCFKTGATLWLTGCFHEDGLADTIDGFGGGWTKSQILRIMRDSRVGSYALMGGSLWALAKATLHPKHGPRPGCTALSLSQTMVRLHSPYATRQPVARSAPAPHLSGECAGRIWPVGVAAWRRHWRRYSR